MTANELADAIDKYLDSILEDAIHPIEEVLDQSIIMLRQLQAENDALRKTVDSLFDGLDSSLAFNKALLERQDK